MMQPKCILLLLAFLLLPTVSDAGPRLLHPLGADPITFWATYQEDQAGNQLPITFELYSRFGDERLVVTGGDGSENLEMVYVGPDGHIVRSRVIKGRPHLTYINSGRRGWGTLMIHDAQGAIAHRDAQFRYLRRLRFFIPSAAPVEVGSAR